LLKSHETIDFLIGLIYKKVKVPVRKVASAVVQFISMATVIGHISQFITRYLTLDVLNARYWDDRISLSAESYEQLLFLKGYLSCTDKKDLERSHICTKVVYSDASDTFYAGYEVNFLNGVAHGVRNRTHQIFHLEGIGCCLQSIVGFRAFP
jgi:hypothetical protein